MADLNDGESVEMKGSGAKPYVLKNVGGVYSCTCPAWRNQSIAIERRTCKHLRKLRGDAAEEARIGSGLPPGPEPDGEDEARRREDGPALAPGRALGQRPGPRRLVAEREARRRSRLLGRQVAHLPAGQPLPRARLVPRGPARDPPRRRAVDRPQGVPAHGRDRPPAGQDRPVEAGPLRRVRRARVSTSAFEGRLAAIRAHVERHRPPYLAAHEHAICTGLDHLRAELARIEALGGEGLMLRQPRSRYEVGRSLTLLKVKSFRDAEARVLEHLKGAGRHKGRLGALLVELADGTQFSVGTGFSDAEREAPRRSARSSPSATRSFPTAACPVSRPTSASGAMPPGRARRRPRPRRTRRSWLRPRPRAAVASGPPVRAGRGIVEQVLGSGPRRLRGDRPVRPDRERRSSQDQGIRERELARSHAEGLIEEKLAKGYRERGEA